MACVLLQHVDKTYPNGVEAVQDLCLEVGNGELFVLAGPSGCGKTTTLRLIAGLEEVTRGEIYFGDRLMNRVSPVARDVAMVFQTPALYPHLSVLDNMAFALRRRRATRAEAERRVREIAEALSIGRLLARRPAELSGGERQRVALGRAIVRQPQVYLFDEPLSDLDARLRIEMREEIIRLRELMNAAILVVTHDQGEAMAMGDRLGVLDRGRMRQVGTPIEVYRRPSSRFVAAFLGSPTMNFFPGQVSQGKFQLQRAAGNGDAAAAIDCGGGVADGPATLGVRPDDLLPGGNGHALGMVRIDALDRRGHETLAHFTIAGGRHTVRLTTDAPLAVGAELRLSVRTGACHLFSAEDGRRLNT
jgi:ABC-type sugar transport system ATPase subunit